MALRVNGKMENDEKKWCEYCNYNDIYCNATYVLFVSILWKECHCDLRSYVTRIQLLMGQDKGFSHKVQIIGRIYKI